MKKLLTFLVALTLLTACSTATQNSLHRQQFIDGMRVPDYFLGGAESYCYSPYTPDKNQFDNVIEIAQEVFADALADRRWTTVRYSNSKTCGWGNQRSYKPISARWKLKDGREFIVEKINIRAYMREFFKTQDTVMQWIKDGREKGLGDGEPGLLLEIRDDTVVLHWVDHQNEIPFAQRNVPDAQYPKGRYLSKPKYVYYQVATINGTPTSNIDFNKRYEVLKK